MTEEEKEKVRTDFYRTAVKECHTFYDDKLAEWYLCKLVEQYEQIENQKNRIKVFKGIRKELNEKIHNLESVAEIRLANWQKCEKEAKVLGERVLQLQKDKGSLTDELNELKEKFAQTVENDEVAYETLRFHDEEEIALLNSEIKELKELINRLKTCDSCKKNIYDDEKELFECSDKTCKHLDKWEIK